MSDTYDRFADAESVFPEFRAETPLERAWAALTGFAQAPGNAMGGRYAPQTAVPGVLTEEDQYRMNHARDREVLDALNLGWFSPRGGSVAARAAADYFPSRAASGSDAERPYSPFTNASGIFPDFDAAAPRKHSVFDVITGRGTDKFAERRARASWAPFVGPKTGERYQTWPERLLRSAATLPGDVVSGAVPGGLGAFGLRASDWTDDPNADQPAELLMERAQDLAGVLGGGPLTMRPSAATLASGAKRPAIGDAGMTRRGLFDIFREKPVEQKIEAAPAAPQTTQLPAVQDPLARLIGGGEAPKSNLLSELMTPPAAQAPSPAEGLMGRAGELAKVLNPEIDRRALLRGAGAVAANASRLGKVAEMLEAKPAEVAAVPKVALPKFEEVWKEGEQFSDQALDEIIESHQSSAFDNFAEEHGRDPTAKEAKRIAREVEKDVLANPHDYAEEFDYALDGPRYSDYQLPGGENYRELLLKMPEHAAEGVRYQVKEEPGQNYPWFVVDKQTGEVVQNGNGKFTTRGYAEDWIKEQGDNAGPGQSARYHSDTWDEPNVLGHLRMHDRDVPGVGKTLHLEELGSEWHQEGSKIGYRGEGPKGLVAKPHKDGGFEVSRQNTDYVIDRYKDAKTPQEAIKMFNDIQEKYNRQPPDAPLKTEWPDYLLRRAIREAVESGHEAVSWTPGEHQARRMESSDPGHVKGVHDFYDKHLVERANEIGKQYGAKVEQRALHDETYDPKEYDKLSRMDYDERVKKGVQVKYEKMIDLQTDDLGRGQLGEVKAPVLRITPALRKAVKDGSFSLLSDTGKPGAAVAALEHAPPFHSAVEKAVIGAKMDKGSPEQWLGYLRNQPGVRKEELEHLGLEDGLKGKKQVAKDEVAAAVREKSPQIKEVWKQFVDDNHYRYGSDSDPKFSEHQLPGGENYRELLMTLPPTKGVHNPRYQEIEQRLMEISELPAKVHNGPEGPALQREHDRLRAEKAKLAEGAQPIYTSSHWDEPNVLAHARMNDRQIPGAGKSLHLEELQSDWHQRGRKEGYSKPRATEAELTAAGKAVEDARSELRKRAMGPNPADLEEINRILLPLQEKYKELATRGYQGVPDAPFKQTWPDLLLKRLVHEAAAKGYDSISWTPGEAQAARYDLSKSISKIDLAPAPAHDHGFYLQAMDHNGNTILDKHIVNPEKELPDVIGKEAADKLMSKDADKGKGLRRLQGLDLKVGGEGMRAFYDKMLVDKANALGKKHGAKVEQVDLGKPEYTIKPVSSYFEVHRDGQNLGAYMTREGAEASLRGFRAKDSKRKNAGEANVHVLHITPRLRAAVLKEGFSLFAAGLPFGALDEGVKKK